MSLPRRRDSGCRSGSLGAVDGFEQQAGPVSAARVEMFSGHVGQGSITFGHGSEPVSTFELAAEQAL